MPIKFPPWHSNLMNTLLILNSVVHFSNEEPRVAESTRWGRILHQVLHKGSTAHCSFQVLFLSNVIIFLDYYEAEKACLCDRQHWNFVCSQRLTRKLKIHSCKKQLSDFYANLSVPHEFINQIIIFVRFPQNPWVPSEVFKINDQR